MNIIKQYHSAKESLPIPFEINKTIIFNQVELQGSLRQ